MKTLRIIVPLILVASLGGCLMLAAGAGAEGGYIAAQENRTAGETISDQAITAAVKTKFLADSDVSGLDINVDTFKGTVMLTGVVDSIFEADKAIEIAARSQGVRSVDSKLVVVQ